MCKNFDRANNKVRALIRFVSEQGKVQMVMQNTQKQYNLKQFKLVLLTHQYCALRCLTYTEKCMNELERAHQLVYAMIQVVLPARFQNLGVGDILLLFDPLGKFFNQLVVELSQNLGYFDLARLKVCLDQMLKLTPDSFSLRAVDLESSNNVEMYKMTMFKAMLYLFRKEYFSGISEQDRERAEQLVMRDAAKCLGHVICGLGAKEGAKSLLYLHPQIILRQDTITLSMVHPNQQQADANE